MCGMNPRHETATFGNFSCIVLHTWKSRAFNRQALVQCSSFQISIFSATCVHMKLQLQVWLQTFFLRLSKTHMSHLSPETFEEEGNQAVVVLRYHASSSFGLFCLLLKLCCSLQKFIPKTRPDFAKSTIFFKGNFATQMYYFWIW